MIFILSRIFLIKVIFGFILCFSISIYFFFLFNSVLVFSVKEGHCTNFSRMAFWNLKWVINCLARSNSNWKCNNYNLSLYHDLWRLCYDLSFQAAFLFQTSEFCSMHKQSCPQKKKKIIIITRITLGILVFLNRPLKTFVQSHFSENHLFHLWYFGHHCAELKGSEHKGLTNVTVLLWVD